jgi:ribosome-associated translation inhibitor RaiA
MNEGNPGPDEAVVTVEGELSRPHLEYARWRIAALARYCRNPLQSGRLTVRVGGASRTARRFYVADAAVIIDGRLLVAHAIGPTPRAVTDAVSDRLRRQLRRVVGAEVARRNDPTAIEKQSADLDFHARHSPAAQLKAPQDRDIILHPVPGEPETTLGALAELLDRDREFDFTLFCHARTAEDVVLHRREDEEFGLLHPPRSPLASEDGVVIPEPSRYPEPITPVDARSEMDVLDHRFLYFIDAGDGRGKVLYLRRDGNYGLVVIR